MPASATERGRRQGQVLPERRYLWDVKTIHGGTRQWYGCARARDDRSGAVAARAHAVHGEDLTEARRLDRERHGTPAGTIGPVQALLRTFPTIRSLVWGHYSEASPDVHSLLAAVAERAADAWRAMGCRDRGEALGVLTSHYRRRWGLLAAREFARHRIRRVPYVGAPRGTRSVQAYGPLGADDVAPLRDAYEAHQAMRAHGPWAGRARGA